MKLSFTKIFFITIGLSLAFVFFAPTVDAAGCCQQTENECTSDECVDTFVGSILTMGLYDLDELIFSKCVDASSKNECKSFASETSKVHIWSSESCDQSSRCGEGKYTPTTITEIPNITIANPLCWPEDECLKVCKGPDPCWGVIQPQDCELNRHYCYTDPTDVELAIDIGGVGRVRDIGSYIALLYNYLIGVLVIVAIVMIMYGGFRWITAAGSPERIGDAKRTIVSAVIGLLLGLFSYTILNIINPATLNLGLPPIKRVRPIYFEIAPMRCQDYKTEIECFSNEYKFNLANNYKNKGCEWRNIGFGSQCTNAARVEGEPGGRCKEGNKCDSGWCTKEEVYYAMNQTEQVSAPHYWCTDGGVDMPCVWDTDCNKGLTCDDNVSACVGAGKGKPSWAECDSDIECSSGFCDVGRCKDGGEKAMCDPESGDADCKDGYKCVDWGKPEPGAMAQFENSFCCPHDQAAYGEGCYIGCTTDGQCGYGYMCWAADNASFKNPETGSTRPRIIYEAQGRCFKLNRDGEKCFTNDQCQSGKCGDKYYYNIKSVDESLRQEMLKLFSKVIDFPTEEGVEYSQIGIGTCQSP